MGDKDIPHGSRLILPRAIKPGPIRTLWDAPSAGASGLIVASAMPIRHAPGHTRARCPPECAAGFRRGASAIRGCPIALARKRLECAMQVIPGPVRETPPALPTDLQPCTSPPERDADHKRRGVACAFHDVASRARIVTGIVSPTCPVSAQA